MNAHTHHPVLWPTHTSIKETARRCPASIPLVAMFARCWQAPLKYICYGETILELSMQRCHESPSRYYRGVCSGPKSQPAWVQRPALALRRHEDILISAACPSALHGSSCSCSCAARCTCACTWRARAPPWPTCGVWWHAHVEKR